MFFLLTHPSDDKNHDITMISQDKNLLINDLINQFGMEMLACYDYLYPKPSEIIQYSIGCREYIVYSYSVEVSLECTYHT